MLVIIKNIYGLLKILFKNEKIQWGVLTKNISANSHIDRKTLIVAPCNMADTTIDKGTYIAANANISVTTIGKFCSIGPNFICGWGIHPTQGLSTSPAFYSTKRQGGFTYSSVNKVEERKPIVIKNDVFIGANVTILDGLTINDGAVIGAGAVVTKDVPAYAIVGGVPAKVIKYRFKQDVISSLLKIQWWDGDEEELKRVETLFNNVEEYIALKNTNPTHF